VNSSLVFLDFTTRDKTVDGFSGAYKFHNGKLSTLHTVKRKEISEGKHKNISAFKGNLSSYIDFAPDPFKISLHKTKYPKRMSARFLNLFKKLETISVGTEKSTMTLQ
jgi:hypothetical protein